MLQPNQVPVLFIELVAILSSAKGTGTAERATYIAGNPSIVDFLLCIYHRHTLHLDLQLLDLTEC